MWLVLYSFTWGVRGTNRANLSLHCSHLLKLKRHRIYEVFEGSFRPFAGLIKDKMSHILQAFPQPLALIILAQPESCWVAAGTSIQWKQTYDLILRKKELLPIKTVCQSSAVNNCTLTSSPIPSKANIRPGVPTSARIILKLPSILWILWICQLRTNNKLAWSQDKTWIECKNQQRRAELSLQYGSWSGSRTTTAGFLRKSRLAVAVLNYVGVSSLFRTELEHDIKQCIKPFNLSTLLSNKASESPTSASGWTCLILGSKCPAIERPAMMFPFPILTSQHCTTPSLRPSTLYGLGCTVLRHSNAPAPWERQAKSAIAIKSTAMPIVVVKKTMYLFIYTT